MTVKRLAASLVLAFFLGGCATIGTKENFAVCQTADAVTTVIALGKGGAEANPIMGAIINKWGFFGMFAVKAALVAAVWYWASGQEDDETVQGTLAVANVITCGVAVHNAGVIRALQ